MSGYYPPGVTGGEDEIAEPDYEKELHGACPRGHFALVEQGYGGRRWVSCGICDYTLDLAPEYEEEV